jgi:tetratricopeptide (TPR) repeat protein
LPYYFEFVPKSKSFSLRNLPYTLLANKFKEFKDKDQLEEAIEACRMRSCMRTKLIGGGIADTATIADLCQIYLEKENYDLAKRAAIKALQVIHPMHALAIKFYCILMQAYYMDNQMLEADVYFSKALAILDHHWGPFHPLHVSVYAIMAQLLISKGKYEDAKYLYQASLLCCIRILGPNHIQTGEVHMDFGKLYLKNDEKTESLQHFTEAYLIYESYFGDQAL